VTIKVTITDCRAGIEPKIFDGARDSKVARFSVVHNERTTENGATKEETRWLQAVAFGPAARFVQLNVHKGTRLVIEDAELHYGRTYTGKDGVERTPDEIHIIPGRGRIDLKEAAGGRQAGSNDPEPA
jgi:single-stranded DNA-binding protein